MLTVIYLLRFVSECMHSRGYVLLDQMLNSGIKLTKFSNSADYSKDLHTYLRYCKDVVFPGIACSVEEEHLIEIFQDLYKGREVMYNQLNVVVNSYSFFIRSIFELKIDPLAYQDWQ